VRWRGAIPSRDGGLPLFEARLLVPASGGSYDALRDLSTGELEIPSYET